MSAKKNQINCPQCGKRNTWQSKNKFKPFCSERCKLIDLGEWASEKYRVAGDGVSKENEDDTE